MPQKESINLRVGSLAFPVRDRVSMTYQTDYRDHYKGATTDDLAATASLKAAGGKQLDMTTDEFAKMVHVDTGHYKNDFLTNTQVAYVRHPQNAYDNPVESIDPSRCGTGRIPVLASSLEDTVSTYDPATGEKRVVQKVRSAVDFGHAPPDVNSVHRKDFVRYDMRQAHTMTAEERQAINLATNKAKFVLGYDPRNTTTEYMASTVQGLAKKAGAPEDKPFKPRDDPTYTTAGEFAKRVHVKFGYEQRDLNSTTRATLVRHPQEAYDNPVQPVDPSTYGDRPGAMDPGKLGVTTLTGAVKEIEKVRSAVDFGHDAPHYMSITMSQQHCVEPSLTKRLGAGHTINVLHKTPYVPVVRNLRYGANADHPALAKQSELQVEELAKTEARAFETAVLAATMFDNKDVATKVIRPGTLPTSHKLRAAVAAVVDEFGGQTLSPREKPVESPTATLKRLAATGGSLDGTARSQ